MSKRDPLRPYMNVIDDMLTQMVLLVFYSFKTHWFQQHARLILPIPNGSLEKIHPLNHKVADWGKMIWTMIQMRNQWQH